MAARSIHPGIARALAVLGLAWLSVGLLAAPARALVLVTDPNDPRPFFQLDRPTGKFDETGLSGFEFLISSQSGVFRANDQYLISGEETEETTSLGSDLGGGGDLSGIPFAFSIQHNLEGGRNFTFRLTNLLTSELSVLCWGEGCPADSQNAATLNGVPPISDYNGLQLQVRAQDVGGSSAAVEITDLTGVDTTGAGFFDEVVTPESPGTIPGDFGRRGQWLLADDLDLVLREWDLHGIVTLTRPDAATSDVTKVRLAVDLVRDPSLPFRVPEPSHTLLVATGTGLLAWRRARARRAQQAAEERRTLLARREADEDLADRLA